MLAKKAFKDLSWLKLKLASDPAGVGGTIIMVVFAVIAGMRWAGTGSLFFGLLLFRDLIWAGFFLVRKKARSEGSVRESALAYISTALPLFYLAPSSLFPAWVLVVTNLLSVCGFLLATLAVIDLGTSAGVAPAVRGDKCRKGVYRWLRHPMYSGYMLAEFGWIVLNPLNAVIYGFSALLYFSRIRAENNIFQVEESAYRADGIWRLALLLIPLFTCRRKFAAPVLNCGINADLSSIDQGTQHEGFL